MADALREGLGEARGSAGLSWRLYVPSPLTGTLFALLGAVGPELRSATGMGYGGLAALFVAQTLGTVVGAAVFGTTRARVFRPVPMAALAGAALLVTLAVGEPLALLPLLFAAGFGCYAVNARAQADLSLAAGAGRARALTLFHVFGGFGLALFPLCIAALLRTGSSWHVPFAVVGALWLAYAVPALGWRHSGDPPGLRLAAVRRIVRGRAGAALLVGCLGTGVMFGVPLWIPTVMRDRFEWSAAASSLTTAVYMTSLLLSRLTVASLAGRVDARRILVASAALTVAGHVVLFAAWSPAALLAAAALIAFGAASLLPVGIARVAQWSGDDRLGAAAVMGLAALSQIVFPALVVAVHAAGLGLQQAAALTVVPALVILAAARRA